MTDHALLSEIADCLLELQQAMRTADLWHSKAPSPAAMASRTPFCADTLAFDQWLQFIFIPRMRHILEAGGPLPENSGIAVMAEAKLTNETAIIDTLKHFDRLIEDHAA